MRATRELLNQKCRLSAFDGQTARISVLASAIQAVVKRKQGDIEAAFSYVFGTPIGIAIDIAADAQTPSATIDPRQPPSPTPTTARLPAAAAPPFSASAPTPPSYSTTAPIAPPSYSTPTPSINPDPVNLAPIAIAQAPVAQAPITQTPPQTQPSPIAPPEPTTSPQAISQPPVQPISQPTTASVNHLPIVSASGRQWDDSEIASAAQQLANFFGGEVVTLDDDVLN